MFDIIIIGAGPAGLTAALYAGRANKSVLVLEKKVAGGQILNAGVIENYPGTTNLTGFDFTTNLLNQVKNLEIPIKYEEVIKIEEKKVITQKEEYTAKKIIIATGAENRKLDLPNEKEWIGRGISYCATCDGNLFRGKTVAVNGGGNTALEDAIYLSDIVEKIYLIHRRDTFRGEEKLVEEVKQRDNIEIIYNSRITSLNGENKLTSIEIENIDHEKKILEVNGLFIAIGQEPHNEIFKNMIEVDEKGYVLSNDGIHTSNKNILVAGDCRVKTLRQLTTAVSDGALAATTAIKEMED